MSDDQAPKIYATALHHESVELREILKSQGIAVENPRV